MQGQKHPSTENMGHDWYISCKKPKQCFRGGPQSLLHLSVISVYSTRIQPSLWMMTMRLLSTLALAALVGAQHQPDHCDRVLGKACGAARAERKECEECLEKMESKDGCS
eukprot:COSAG02_NODE_5349_length_4409_cov_1.517633_6_plen_110_part_00